MGIGARCFAQNLGRQTITAMRCRIRRLPPYLAFCASVQHESKLSSSYSRHCGAPLYWVWALCRGLSLAPPEPRTKGLGQIGGDEGS